MSVHVKSKKSCFAALLLALLVICGMPLSAATPANAPAAKGAVLYYLPNCAHCQKVEAYLQSIHKRVAMKNIMNPVYQDELTAYGQDGVPVLVVNNQVIVGASSIISFLSNHPEVLR